MKAVGYQKSLPIEDANSLLDFETAKPEPKGRDIRVAVKAISANPVDYKVRKRAAPPAGEHKILGFDAAGVIDAVGPDVSLFKPGDEVFYAGSILRQGTNSEFHLVDERIVGKKPNSLSFAQAAALPLTSITAWELLFDRLGAVPGKSLDPRTLLITGGAGGVGSILIQLARRLTGLTVVATATRPESQKWCRDLGAHAVIDHGKPMKEQIEALKLAFADAQVGAKPADHERHATYCADRVITVSGQLRDEADFAKPFVAVCNSYVDIVPGHVHLQAPPLERKIVPLAGATDVRTGAASRSRTSNRSTSNRPRRPAPGHTRKGARRRSPSRQGRAL